MEICRSVLRLGEGEHILETREGMAAYVSPGVNLVFVTGYYGYGKTYGVGYYVICQALARGEPFLYVNVRDLGHVISKLAVDVEAGGAQGLEDLLLILAQVARGDLLKRLADDRVVITNVDLENIASAVIANAGDPVRHFVREFAKVSARKSAYLILDEVESGIRDVKSFIERVCTTVRNEIYDAGYRNIKLILLLQEAVLVAHGAEPRCSTIRGAEGITRAIKLRGYGSDVYLKYIKDRIGEGGADERELKKIAELVSEFPPRVAFDVLRQYITYGELTYTAFKDFLSAIFKDTKESFLLELPKSGTEYFMVVGEVVNDLRNNKIEASFEEVKSKVYRLWVSCEREKKKEVYMDLRAYTKEERESDADVSIFTNGEDLMIATKSSSPRPVMKFRHFLMAYYPGESHIQGLGEMYNQFRLVFREALRRAACKS
ncbi:hypothetical protein [Pyrobaculum neutrophilum]|uniref:ATPase domain-containing protein n=1 Tax=Pyrobaculum neutrophilum (strain DSM 2338 / JCM 9278 / NBRC 100436 / V24Sta) TaxID=444157 RepID=B1YE33_PYRNV|nr:hypothetical protein [Pyrobaculum neutrophilum]ACB40046.1 hypothetical protein Tneu_1115 [Pyrobaculum neutrophilum V24Sta]